MRLKDLAGELSPWTVSSLKWKFGTARFDALRKMPARKIDVEHIKDFLSALYKEGLKKSTIHSYRALLGAVFAYALEGEHVVFNPVLKTSPPKQVRGRIRFLSPDEEQAMRPVIQEFWPDREAEFDVLLHTGMRIGELWHLTWDRVHPDRNVVEVPDEGKTGWRDIPLNSASRLAFEALHRQSSGSAFVVPHVFAAKRGQRYGARWIQAAAAKAGVLNVSPHTLRHTFASRLTMAGVNVRRVQEYMGHTSIEMTMKYAHLSPEHAQSPDLERLVAGAVPAVAVPAAARMKPPARVKIAVKTPQIARTA